MSLEIVTQVFVDAVVVVYQQNLSPRMPSKHWSRTTSGILKLSCYLTIPAPCSSTLACKAWYISI
ncbi:hypothetical protein Dimus_027538, partial [Dionaea muscipula]